MLRELLIFLGTITMRVLRIKEHTTELTDEMTMQPSPGRSFINFDYYDPDQLQRNRSENS
jgi:hypothetical protein